MPGCRKFAELTRNFPSEDRKRIESENVEMRAAMEFGEHSRDAGG